MGHELTPLCTSTVRRKFVTHRDTGKIMGCLRKSQKEQDQVLNKLAYRAWNTKS